MASVASMADVVIELPHLPHLPSIKSNFMHNHLNTRNFLPELKFDKRRRRVKHCPCGKSNQDGKFAPYVGFEDKGYCHSCGENFLPALPERENWKKPGPQQKSAIKPVSFIDAGILNNTLSSYEHNHFAIFLASVFGKEVAHQLLEKYYVGTAKKWPGATVFWQIDLLYQIRTGKIMLYSHSTGKRVKEPFHYFSYAHTALELRDFNLAQCFFGEHLLKGSTKPVAIAESEKTAILASQYLPQFTWLASGGSGGLTSQKCMALRGRHICLFPDLSKPEAKTNCYEEWSKKAKELSKLMPDTLFQVSTLLERNATAEERNQGLDLADYLLRFNHTDFLQFEEPKPKAITTHKIAIQSLPSPAARIKLPSDRYRLEQLKRKYPAIATLSEKLALEVINISSLASPNISKRSMAPP